MGESVAQHDAGDDRCAAHRGRAALALVLGVGLTFGGDADRLGVAVLEQQFDEQRGADEDREHRDDAGERRGVHQRAPHDAGRLQPRVHRRTRETRRGGVARIPGDRDPQHRHRDHGRELCEDVARELLTDEAGQHRRQGQFKAGVERTGVGAAAAAGAGAGSGAAATGAGAGAGCVGVIDFGADFAAGCVATLAPGRTISAVTSARGAPSGL